MNAETLYENYYMTFWALEKTDDGYVMTPYVNIYPSAGMIEINKIVP